MESYQIVDQTLKKVARGTAIVFSGTIAGMLIGLGTRTIIVRYITLEEYGIFSLAVVLVGIFSALATLGLAQGATRYIAYFRGKNELSKIKEVVFSSLGFTLIASVLLSIVLFFTSDVLSTKAFHNPELSTPLKILAVGIPFTVLTTMLASVFRGFDRVDVQVYFGYLLRGGLFLLSLGAVVLFNLHFFGVIYAVLASAVISCVALAIYTIIKSPLPSEGVGNASSMRKELLLFSLPLLGTGMLSMVIMWTDTLMLGYFKTPSDVALYNGALPLAKLIPLILMSMGSIFVPVLSQLYARGFMNEMKRSYQVLTKWISSISLPLFLLLMVFPGDILNIFFGSQYVEAATALRILSLGLFFHTFLGANSTTLIVIGRTRLVMRASLIAALLNVALNVGLIPLWGITGAAIASMASYFVSNSYLSVRLYHLYRIHPLTKNYMKPVIVSIAVVLLIYALTTTLLTITFWMLPLFFILFSAVYILSLFLTKSFDSEDIALLLAIEKRAGVNTGPIKNILRRFI